jgi:DNA-binding MarR family transcriptional regulator
VPRLSVTPLDLLFQNLRLLQGVSLEAEPRIRQLELEMKEFVLLSKLDANPYPADLARVLMLPKPSVTFLVKRMENAKFLKREIQPGDLRRFRLSLTPRGREAVKEGKKILNQIFGQRLKKLSREEIQSFSNILERMTCQ